MLGFPLPIAHWIIIYGISLLLLIMFVVMIASWFGLAGRFAFLRFLERLIQPFIAPVRRIVPPIGMIDISFFVTYFLLLTLQVLLLQGLPNGW